ncbi:MAG: N-acyl homoserine lactonase family protein, partial [Leptospiraceae bacterium]|nr:N-acyl homoserine lactonase family protein [Leptospiraceae bacterium]
NKQKFIITGDECYFENACSLKIPLPKAAAYSIDSNKKFLNSISDDEKILTLHDPIYLPGDKIHFRKIYPD